MSLNLLKQIQSEKQMYAALRSAKKWKLWTSKLVCSEMDKKANRKPVKKHFVQTTLVYSSLF